MLGFLHDGARQNRWGNTFSLIPTSQNDPPGKIVPELPVFEGPGPGELTATLGTGLFVCVVEFDRDMISN